MDILDMSSSIEDFLLSQPSAQNQKEQEPLTEAEKQKQIVEQKRRQLCRWLNYPTAEIEDFSINAQGGYDFYFAHVRQSEFNKLFKGLDPMPELGYGDKQNHVSLTKANIDALENQYKDGWKKFYAVLLTLLACTLFAIASVYATYINTTPLAFIFGTFVGSALGIVCLWYARKVANRSELLDSLHKNFKPKRGWLIIGGLVFAVSLILRIVSAQSFVAPLTAVLFAISIFMVFLASLTIRKQNNFGFDSDQVVSVDQANVSSNSLSIGLNQPLLGADPQHSASLLQSSAVSSSAQSMSYQYSEVDVNSSSKNSATSSIAVNPPQPLPLPQPSATASSQLVVAMDGVSSSNSASFIVGQTPPPPAYSSLPPDSSSVVSVPSELVEPGEEEGIPGGGSACQAIAPPASLSNASTPVAFSLSQHVLNP